MSNQKLKEATEKYIGIVLGQAEDKAGVSMTEVLVESTVIVDKLSNSLLIVAGAAITLGVGNAKSIILALGIGNYKLLITFLLLSAIFGFLSKFAHAFSLMALNTAKELIARFDMIFNEFDKFEEEQIEKVKGMVEIESRRPNLNKIFESFINSMPVFLQDKIKLSLKNRDGDSKKLQRAASTAAIYQVILFSGQTLLLIIAFSSAVIGIE